MASDIIGLVREGTKKWTRTVKAEEHSPASLRYRTSRMTRERGTSIKEAAAQVMEAAYMEMSGNGQLPGNARQIMYKAPPHTEGHRPRARRQLFHTRFIAGLPRRTRRRLGCHL
jgi:hypothetical protein